MFKVYFSILFKLLNIFIFLKFYKLIQKTYQIQNLYIHNLNTFKKTTFVQLQLKILLLTFLILMLAHFLLFKIFKNNFVIKLLFF